MEIVKDRFSANKEGIMERRDTTSLCELLFNIGSSKSLQQEFSINTLEIMVEPLRLALVNNFETIFKTTNKMLILKAIWGLSRLGLVKE